MRNADLLIFFRIPRPPPQTLNKNNLHHVNEETCNHFPPPLATTNMFATTYYPPGLKYDFHPDSPCRSYLHS